MGNSPVKNTNQALVAVIYNNFSLCPIPLPKNLVGRIDSHTWTEFTDVCSDAGNTPNLSQHQTEERQYAHYQWMSFFFFVLFSVYGVGGTVGGAILLFMDTDKESPAVMVTGIISVFMSCISLVCAAIYEKKHIRVTNAYGTQVTTKMNERMIVLNNKYANLVQFHVHKMNATPTNFKKHVVVCIHIMVNIMVQSVPYISGPLSTSNTRLSVHVETATELQSKDEKAGYDPATNLPMKSIMYEQLIDVCNNNVLNIAVCSADMDGMKQLNDTLGHHVTDNIIKSMADLMANQAKGNKFVSIYRMNAGGDEFGMIVVDTDNETVFQWADDLRKEIDKSTKASISIGIAMRKNKETKDQWFNRADDALMKAKNKGKNVVVLAE